MFCFHFSLVMVHICDFDYYFLALVLLLHVIYGVDWHVKRSVEVVFIVNLSWIC